MVAPAGEFKPRTSAKVRFGSAMNIYTERAAFATETTTECTAPQAQSWRDTLPIHPAAELFPRMSEAELAALGKDIRKHGLTSSIAVWSDGKSPKQLLDGRSRLDAIEIEIGPAIVGPPSVMAGKDFLAVNKVIVLDRSVNPYAFVISANIQRRHLTGEQKHELIAKLIETDPTKSNRQIAKTVKVDHKTVASVRAEKEGRGEIPHVETRTDSKGRKQPARKTTTKPPPVSAEVLQQREAAAGRIRGRMGGNKVRDDIGSESAGECERLRARNEELQAQLTHFEFQNIALRGEVGELKEVRKPSARTRARARIVNLATCCVRGIAHRRAHARNSRRASGSSQLSPVRATGSTSPHAYGGPRHDVGIAQRSRSGRCRPAPVVLRCRQSHGARRRLATAVVRPPFS